jgi:hypothetical protein
MGGDIIESASAGVSAITHYRPKVKERRKPAHNIQMKKLLCDIEAILITETDCNMCVSKLLQRIDEWRGIA